MSGYEIAGLTISISAMLVSCLALGWNIYRDVVLKPRLKVRLTLSFIASVGYESPTKICIEGTNYGPNKINCENICAKKSGLWRWLFRKCKYAIIMYDYTDPYSTKLPCELDVGKSCHLFFTYKKDSFLSEGFTHIGIIDSFGRKHYVPKSDIKKTRKKYLKEFDEKN